MVQKESADTIQETLCSFFCRTIRTYDKQLLPIAEDIAAYWKECRQNAPAEPITEDAAQWFYAAFCLLDNSLSDDMDFSDEDWNAFQSIITAYSDSLSIEFLESFMSTVLERHKIN